MKFVVCTVGGSPKPIVDTLKMNTDAFVYFIASKGTDPNSCSAATIKSNYSKLVTVQCPNCGNVKQKKTFDGLAELANLQPEQYKIVEVEPDWFESVYGACVNIHKEIKEKSAGHPYNVIAEYTGGTKTMSGVLLLYGSSQRPTWDLFLQTTVGRSNLQKESHGNIGRIQPTDMAVFDGVVEKCLELMEKKHYETAEAILTQFFTEQKLAYDQTQKLTELLTTCRMFSAWSRFDHESAFRFSSAVPDLNKKYGRQLRILSSTAGSLRNNESLNRKNITVYNLVSDLVENAENCGLAGRYDDGTGRLYRATELLAQIHLKRIFSIDTGNIDLKNEAIPADAKEKLMKDNVHHPEKIQTGLFASYILLNDLKDALGSYALDKENKRSLQIFIEKRNESLFAHGLQPIDKDKWDNYCANWVKWIRKGIEVAKKV